MISIIIIVKNDREIANTLNSLKSINKPTNVEIIVVDSSSGTLRDIQKKFPSVKWFNYKNKIDKKVTIPEQRNVGIKKAKSDIIVFIDANCVPTKNWLVELYKYHIKHNELIVAGATKPFDESVVNTINHEKLTKKYLDEAPTINILYHKSVFKKIGFFDEEGTYGEDVDLAWRAVEAGYKIRYAKKALIYHNWGDFFEQTKRMIRYGSVRPRLYRKHRNKIREIIIGKNIITTIYPLFILFLPLTFIFPYYPLLILIPMLKNINNKPIQTTYLNLIYGSGVLIGVYNEFIKPKSS